MLYFSGSYTNYLHHFVIQNMPNLTDYKKTMSAQIAGIVKNILTRSNQVKPSNKLLPLIDANIQEDYPCFLPKNKSKPTGSSTNFDLFYEQSKQILKEYYFCANMFASTLTISDLIDDSSTIQVTAYLPVAKLGIIIVEDTVDFSYLDAIAPKLQKEDIILLCISQSSFIKKDCEFDDLCLQIQLNLNKKKEYLTPYQSKILPTKEQLIPVIIYRFQILVLSLLERGVLDFTAPWNFNIYCQEASDFGQQALDDLYDYIKAISILCNEVVTLPTIKFKQSAKKAKKEGWINIAISTTTLWDFSKKDDFFIWIKSDYFSDTTGYLPAKYFQKAVPHNLQYHPIITPDSAVENALLYLINLFFETPTLSENTLLPLVYILNSCDGIIRQKQNTAMLQSALIASMLHAKTTIIVCANQVSLMEKTDMITRLNISENEFFILKQTPFLQADIETLKKTKPYFLLMTPDLFSNAIFLKFYQTIENTVPVSYIILDEIDAISTFSPRFCIDYFQCCKKIRKIGGPQSIFAFFDDVNQKILQDCCDQLYLDASDVIAYPLLTTMQNHLTLYDINNNNTPLYYPNTTLDPSLILGSYYNQADIQLLQSKFNTTICPISLEKLSLPLQKIQPMLTKDNFGKDIVVLIDSNDDSIKELLYFFSVMGVVEDWYFTTNEKAKQQNNLVYHIKIRPFHTLSIQNNVQSYMNLHDAPATNFNFTNIMESAPVVFYLKALVTWCNTIKATQKENQLLEILSILNNQSLLSSYNQMACKSQSLTDNYYLLYSLFYDNIDLHTLLTLLYHIEQEKLSEQRFTFYQVASFLIVTKPNSVSICLLYGLLQLLFHKYNAIYDSVYFKFAFENIIHETEQEFNFLDDILKIASLLSTEKKEIISEYLCNYYPNAIEIIYKCLDDNVSLQHILVATASKILKLGEQFNDKCR